MIVVDTNVWSELAKKSPEKAVINWEATRSPWLFMSAIVLAEWRAGAALMPAGRGRDALTEIIEAVVGTYRDRLLVFDERCAQQFGLVLSDARAAGTPIVTADAMIAATARAHGARLATRNANDFAGAGVEIIDPWQA